MNENIEINHLVDKIIKGFKKHYPELNIDTIWELFGDTKIIEVPKKQILLKTGHTDKRIIFVVKGLFRAYYDKGDSEITTWFRPEFSVFASYSSIFANNPSKLSYQAIEDSVVVILDYELLKEKAKTDFEVAKSIIVVLESILTEVILNLEDFIMLSPEERFLQTMENKHTIINRVPQNQLASILGITPESLSRIKTRLKNKD
jgi:CRP-like cAMP-binding protein